MMCFHAWIHHAAFRNLYAINFNNKILDNRFTVIVIL